MKRYLVSEGVSVVTKRNEKFTPDVRYFIMYGKIVSLEEGIYIIPMYAFAFMYG